MVSSLRNSYLRHQIVRGGEILIEDIVYQDYIIAFGRYILLKNSQSKQN
jgi:hypothetical protein